MRQRRFLLLRASGPWAGIPLSGVWLGVTLLTLLAGQVSAGGRLASSLLSDPQAPTGTIVAADIGTSTVWTLEGSPYRVLFDSDGIQVADGATLTVEPGVEVQFDPNASLIVLGTLKAIGTEAQPILFTGTAKEEGSWLFLAIESSSLALNQGSVLRHVTIEYAQWDLMLYAAAVHLSDCILRHASEVGLWAGAAAVVMEGCQLVVNVVGVENSYGSLILAANNWWGDASGPQNEACNPSGGGDAIEDTYAPGVVFRPFLTAPDQEPAPVVASDALRLSLAPQRWFAPADGVALIPVKITLRDGAGRALPGRSIRLQSDMGTVSGAGITDSQGETLAYIASDTPGDAVLTAMVEESDNCECVAGPQAVVTFGEAADDTLLPGAEAPYMNGDIQVEPKPIIQGVPSTVRARLTNPNSYPIEVNATFAYAEYGIGVAFAPLGGLEGVRLEAHSEREISVPWTPPASGHVCLRLDYVAQPVSRPAAGIQAVGGGQTNFAIEPGPLGSPGTQEADEDPEDEPDEGDAESEKDCLKKTTAAIDAINDGQMALDAVSSPENLSGLAIPNLMFSYIMDFNLESWARSTQALGQCPPRQDYDTYATVESYTFTPLIPGDDLSVARAAAGNALMEAMLDLTAQLRAATLSLDRYSGAANAGDLHWASEQAATLIYFKEESGTTMLKVADRLDALLAVMRDEGAEDLTVTAEEVFEYQVRLALIGFFEDEIVAARSIGMSDAEIEAIRQARIAADSEELAGSVMTRLAAIADALRPLGAVLMNPPNFDEAATTRAADASLASTNLARIFFSQTSFRIDNPLAEATTVELRVRSLDLPPDWMASVSPTSVYLQAGEGVTGLLTIRPGLAAVQGTRPRVAVEGYVGDELLGGVVVEVMVPRHEIAGPRGKVYLPLVLRSFVR